VTATGGGICPHRPADPIGPLLTREGLASGHVRCRVDERHRLIPIHEKNVFVSREGPVRWSVSVVSPFRPPFL
jgi:hypothetical protein